MRKPIAPVFSNGVSICAAAKATGLFFFCRTSLKLSNLLFATIYKLLVALQPFRFLWYLINLLHRSMV